jgi:hypothetical protein
VATIFEHLRRDGVSRRLHDMLYEAQHAGAVPIGALTGA